MQVENEGNKKIANGINLVAGTNIFITKLSATKFSLFPVQFVPESKVFFLDDDGQKIDSQLLFTSYPFSFGITHRNVVHSIVPNWMVYQEMTHLFVKSRENCNDHLDSYKLLNYEFVIERNDSIIYSRLMKGNELFSDNLKKYLKEICKTGDLFAALNICMEAPDKPIYKEEKAYLYRVQ